MSGQVEEPMLDEASVLRAEADVTQQEASVAKQMRDAERLERTVQQRLNALLTAVERRLAGDRHPDVVGLMSDLQGLRLPKLNLEGPSQEALRARQAAVLARQQAVQEMNQGMQTFLAALDTLSATINDSEASFSRLPKAAPPPAEKPAPQRHPAESTRPASAGIERRQQPRVELQAVVGFESEDNFYTGFSSDISEGGLFVSTINVLPPGSDVHLEFSLPNGFRAKVQGIVRWVREWNDATPTIPPGMGVQFTSLPPEALGQLHAFVSEREPLFFDS